MAARRCITSSRHSPWACEGLLTAMAQEAARLLAASARPGIIDETSFPKAGRHSVRRRGHQYCAGAGQDRQLPGGGEPALCGGARWSRAASAGPWGWRLFCAHASGIGDAVRRQKAGVPEGISYRSKNALALELVEGEARARGLPPAPVLADSDYGDDYRWPSGTAPTGRGLLRGGSNPAPKAWTQEAGGQPTPGRRSARCPRTHCPPPKRLDQIARELPARVWRPDHLGARAPVAPCRAASPGVAVVGQPRLHPSASTGRERGSRVAPRGVAPGQKTRRLITGSRTWTARPGRPTLQRAGSAWRGSAGGWNRITGS